MKPYGVTIQMKAIEQYFQMVLFIFKYFTKRNLRIVFNLILGTLGRERVKRKIELENSTFFQEC